MRLEVLTAVKISLLVFWVVMPCGLVGRYQCFGETYCHTTRMLLFGTHNLRKLIHFCSIMKKLLATGSSTFHK
jgi:hypothetical protein